MGGSLLVKMFAALIGVVLLVGCVSKKGYDSKADDPIKKKLKNKVKSNLTLDNAWGEDVFDEDLDYRLEESDAEIDCLLKEGDSKKMSPNSRGKKKKAMRKIVRISKSKNMKRYINIYKRTKKTLKKRAIVKGEDDPVKVTKVQLKTVFAGAKKLKIVNRKRMKKRQKTSLDTTKKTASTQLEFKVYYAKNSKINIYDRPGGRVIEILMRGEPIIAHRQKDWAIIPHKGYAKIRDLSKIPINRGVNYSHWY